MTAETLRARHRDDLSEALDLIPGIAIQNTGQRREKTISLRGFTSRQVPLFIDGVPVYVPYDGNVDLTRFGVGYISEIVVSKELASLLYGPNTLGRVSVEYDIRKVIGVAFAREMSAVNRSGCFMTDVQDQWKRPSFGMMPKPAGARDKYAQLPQAQRTILLEWIQGL